MKCLTCDASLTLFLARSDILVLGCKWQELRCLGHLTVHTGEIFPEQRSSLSSACGQHKVQQIPQDTPTTKCNTRANITVSSHSSSLQDWELHHLGIVLPLAPHLTFRKMLKDHCKLEPLRYGKASIRTSAPPLTAFQPKLTRWPGIRKPMQGCQVLFALLAKIAKEKKVEQTLRILHQHHQLYPVFRQSWTKSPVPSTSTWGLCNPHSGSLVVNKTVQAWQPNVIHLYLLAVKLSSDDQAASGKLSLSVRYKDRLELLSKALWRRCLPSHQ